MAKSSASSLASLPSVDRLLQRSETDVLIAAHGRMAATDAIRGVLAELRAAQAADLAESEILRRVAERLEREATPSLRARIQSDRNRAAHQSRARGAAARWRSQR